jgi:hypothetical protein
MIYCDGLDQALTSIHHTEVTKTLYKEIQDIKHQIRIKANSRKAQYWAEGVYSGFDSGLFCNSNSEFKPLKHCQPTVISTCQVLNL